MTSSRNGVLCPESLAGFLFALELGKAYQLIPSVFCKTPQADLLQVFLIVHECRSQYKSIKGCVGGGWKCERLFASVARVRDIFYFGIVFILMDIDKIKDIETQIGHSFTNKDILVQAVTTKSYAKEENDHKRPCKSQEDFRTHGDAILKEVLIDILKEHGYETPQQITEAKSQLENGVKLAEIFSAFKIPPDHFQKRSGEGISVPLCAETFESLIYAIYIDISVTTNEGNAKTEIKRYIKRLFEPHINNLKQ